MKYLVIFSAIALSSVFYSCNKTKTAFTHATMKPWFDTNCASCHASGKSDANAWEYDATDYESSIKGHISKINNLVTVSKTMPPTGLTSTEIQKFSDWYAAGAPAN